MEAYRKVYIKKDGFPKEDGRYIVGFSVKYILPKGDQISDCSFMADYDKQYSFHEEMTDCSGIEWWLQKIEIPTYEQACQKIKSESRNDWAGVAFLDGVNWMLMEINK